MSGRPCGSCGSANPGTRIYCTNCGSILSAPAGKEIELTPPAVALASRRVKEAEGRHGDKTPFLSRVVHLLFFIAAVALGVLVVLALMEPREFDPQSGNSSVAPTLPSASALIDRAIVSARVSPVTVSQQVINEFLRVSGRVEWKPPFAALPVPLWLGSHIVIEPDKVAYFVELSFLDYPIHLSETFRLVGAPRQWRLEPLAASIGLLPLSESASRILTPFMMGTTATLDREISVLRSAERLVLRRGFVEFAAR
jgi:hypothetical protein